MFLLQVPLLLVKILTDERNWQQFEKSTLLAVFICKKWCSFWWVWPRLAGKSVATTWDCHAIGRELNLAALSFDRFLKQPKEPAELQMIYSNAFEGVSDTQLFNKTLRLACGKIALSTSWCVWCQMKADRLQCVGLHDARKQEDLSKAMNKCCFYHFCLGLFTALLHNRICCGAFTRKFSMHCLSMSLYPCFSLWVWCLPSSFYIVHEGAEQYFLFGSS